MPNYQGKVRLTEDEIVATLSHSSLPTLIVEGDSDAIVFRPLEVEMEDIGLSVMPVGGRTVALNVLARSEEFSNSSVAFIVDRDRWIYGRLPRGLGAKGVFVTNGYSVENDVLRDGRVLRYLTPAERTIFDREVAIFCDWYALAVARNATNPSSPFENHPSEFLDNLQRFTTATALVAGEAYPTQLRVRIFADYMRLLRGKSLMSLFVRRLDRPGRPARHNGASILDIVAHHPGPHLRRLYREVRRWFGRAPGGA